MSTAYTVDELKALAEPWAGCALTIGNFDGVHRGHQALLAGARQLADANGGLALALTFEPHPVRFFRPDVAPFRLDTSHQRNALLTHYGAHQPIVLKFDRSLARLEPEAFVRRVILDTFAPSAVIVGYDFAFGKGAQGTPTQLRSLLEAAGVATRVEPAVELDATAISSSRIRDALREGRVAEVRRLLGHPHALVGAIVHGRGRGKGLGFPTANLAVDNELLPANGVYATRVELEGVFFEGITNVGVRPTFDDVGLTVESFVLDQRLPEDADLYGRQTAVHLIERLREERRFESPAKLVAQIERDLDACRAHHGGDPAEDVVAQALAEDASANT